MTPNSEDCWIYIDGTPHAWYDGEAILFDETYIHSVKNETDETRVILFCDVTRPLHTPVVRGLNRSESTVDAQRQSFYHEVSEARERLYYS